MSNTFPLFNRIRLVNPAANLDVRYGPWPTFNDALTGFDPGLREPGLTVAVSALNQPVVECWYKNGVSDNDLILKSSDITEEDILPTVTNYLSTNNVLVSSLNVTQNAVINTDSITPALKITQIGTGPAFYVEDLINDTTPVVIDQFGCLSVGASATAISTLNPCAQFVSNTGRKRVVEIRNHGDVSPGQAFPELRFIKIRNGDVNNFTPTVLSAEDILGAINFLGSTTSGAVIISRNKYDTLTGVPSGVKLTFQTHVASTNTINDILILNEDKVGISTPDPNEKLTVTGNISSSETIFSKQGNSQQWGNVYSVVSQTSGNWTGNYQIIPEGSTQIFLDTKQYDTFYKKVTTPNQFTFLNAAPNHSITIYLIAEHEQALRHYFPAGVSLSQAGESNLAYTFKNKITKIVLQNIPSEVEISSTWVGQAIVIEEDPASVLPPTGSSILLDIGLGYIVQENGSYILLD